MVAASTDDAGGAQNWYLWHHFNKCQWTSQCASWQAVRDLPLGCVSCLGFPSLMEMCTRWQPVCLGSDQGHGGVSRTFFPFPLPESDSLWCSLCSSMHLEMASSVALPHRGCSSVSWYFPIFTSSHFPGTALLTEILLCLMMMSYFYCFPDFHWNFFSGHRLFKTMLLDFPAVEHSLSIFCVYSYHSQNFNPFNF